AFATDAAGTAASTTSATSINTGGYGDIAGAGRFSTTGIASRSSSIAAVRFGRPIASTTLGCSSPAYPTGQSPTSSRAHRPGCHGAWSAASTVSSTPEMSATTRAVSMASAQLA